MAISPEHIFIHYLKTNCRGRERATTAEEIASATGISPRQQQTLLLSLEAKGVDVATACDHRPMGTYIPEADVELSPYLHQLRERRNAIASRIARIEARHPGLREARTIRPMSRTEPDGKVGTMRLELDDLPEGMIPDPEDCEEMVEWGQMADGELHALMEDAVTGG